jgi:LPS export ABC transporter protein LptC
MPLRNTIRRAGRAAAALLFSLILATCSLDYGALQGAEVMPEDIPQAVIYNFAHTVVTDGKPSFRLYAEKAEEFSSRKTTMLTGVSFVEYGEDGTPVTTGTAAKAVFHTDTENAELSGSLLFQNKREDAVVKAAFIAWDNELKKLTAKPDDIVIIEKTDGSKISGRGFVADARTRSVSFTSGADGTYVFKDEKKD